MATNFDLAPEIEEYRIFNFSGGLNNQFSNSLLEDHESSELMNVVLNEKGVFRKRKGLTPAEGFGNGTERGKIIQIYSDNIQYLVSSDSSHIDRYFQFVQLEDFSVWTKDLMTDAWIEVTMDSLPFTSKFQFFTFNRQVYFVNPTQGGFKLNVLNNTLGELWWEVADVGGIPNASMVAIRDSRVFYSGDPTNLEYVYYSQIANCESVNMNINDSVYGGTTPEGGGGIIRIATIPNGPVTGLEVFQDTLIIFKESTVHALSGKDPLTDWKITPISVAMGCIDHNTIQRANNAIYYLSKDGVYSIYSPFQAQISATPISIKIQPEIRKYVECENKHSVFANSKYYLFCDEMTLMFDDNLSAWTKFDLKTSCSFYDGVVNEVLTANELGYVYKFSKTSIDDEFKPNEFTPINSYYCTPFLSLGAPEKTKKFKWIKTFFRPNQVENSSIDLEIEIDYIQSWATLNSEYIAATWGSGEWGRTHWGTPRDEISDYKRINGLGSYIRFTFSNNRLGEDMRIHGFTLGFKTKSRIR
jgi:hypothetical protein